MYKPLKWWLIGLGYRDPRRLRRNGNHIGLWLFRILWCGMIMALLCVAPIASIVDYVIERHKIQLSLMFFSVIIPVQYALGCYYYRKSHLESILFDCEDDKFKWIPNQRAIFGSIIGLSTILMIIDWTLVGVVGNPQQFRLIWGGEGTLGTSTNLWGGEGGGWFYVFLAVFWLVSWSVLVTNMVVFCVVFGKHVIDLRNLFYFIQEEFAWRMEKFAITDLSKWIVDVRYAIGGSISLLENFYTTATIFGAIGLGSLVEFKEYDAYLLYYTIIYVFLQVILMVFIYFISKLRSDMYKLIRSPMVMSRYLTKMKNMELRMMEEGQQTSRGINQKDNKVIAGVDWLILQKILSERWAEFSLLGIEFGNAGVIKKGMGMTSLIVLGSSYLNGVLAN